MTEMELDGRIYAAIGPDLYGVMPIRSQQTGV